jgi:hypothetical protein
MTDLNWSFYQIWNSSLENRQEREIKPRDMIWASELGGSYLDRILKMKGVPPSNPPNARSLRKFEAGNIWEWIIGFVLKRAGILISRQDLISYQYPELLKVSGKLDFIAGGKPDWEKAKNEINNLDLPDFIQKSTLAIIDNLQKQFPNELKKIILEVKSKSSMLFDRVEQGVADPNHKLQLFHYLKASDMDEGHIVYICKDDCRMMEIGVMNPSEVESDYKKDIETITSYYSHQELPPKEAEVTFEEETFKFRKNWKVGYSNYLTMNYGYKDTAEFDLRWDKSIASWNRVFARFVQKANITTLNMEIAKEIKTYFPNFEDMVVIAQNSGKIIEEGGEQDGGN